MSDKSYHRYLELEAAAECLLAALERGDSVVVAKNNLEQVLTRQRPRGGATARKDGGWLVRLYSTGSTYQSKWLPDRASALKVLEDFRRERRAQLLDALLDEVDSRRLSEVESSQ